MAWKLRPGKSRGAWAAEAAIYENGIGRPIAPTHEEQEEWESIRNAEDAGEPAEREARTAWILARFVARMRSELKTNYWKGDWRTEVDGDEEASFEVLYHAAKLDWALRTNNVEAIREFAADTANCALIASDMQDVWREDPEPENDPLEARPHRRGYGGHQQPGGVVLEDAHAERLRREVRYMQKLMRGEVQPVRAQRVRRK